MPTAEGSSAAAAQGGGKSRLEIFKLSPLLELKMLFGYFNPVLPCCAAAVSGRLKLGKIQRYTIGCASLRFLSRVCVCVMFVCV